MAVFSANTVVTETLTIKELGSTDWTTGPEKFSRVDDSQLSSGLLKYDKYTTTFTVSANTAVYIKATFMGNLDRSSATPSESAYEAVTYEILNDSVEVEHLYNLHAEELIMKATRTATSSVTTIDLELQNLNDQTFFFTAYYEVYTFDGSTTSISGVSSNFLFGERGIFAGGTAPGGRTDAIDYIAIGTPATNASDWGNLSVVKGNLVGTSDASRAVIAGGALTSGYTDAIDYFAIGTPTTTASDWGNLTQARTNSGGTSDGSRGVFGGGYTSTTVNTMDYIAIGTPATTATDFGDLTIVTYNVAALSDGYRGVFGGGEPPMTNVMAFVTISTPGNATDFGDLTTTSKGCASASDGTRGLFAGQGSPLTNKIDMITIATTGNANDFGDVTVSRAYFSGCSNGSRGAFGGGENTDVIDYVTISTTGNATDWGNLTTVNYGLASASGD